ncbi:hypothetical protein [Achromobacter mucicolens]|uniref:hypothetical protein n=1 Tax=Achromobacter mucicolens TaxID=1389922 RepID=UPI002FE1190B
MHDATTAWLENGSHLPPPLRDFHDQKDVFKAMHDIINVQGHEYARSVDWVTGQCYVIDIFLWFMARRGYTLQRSRAKVPFRDLNEDVENARSKRLPQALPTRAHHKDGGEA